jgi:hypothetical protein
MNQSDLLQSSTAMVEMQHSCECLLVWVVADLVFNGFGKFLNAPKAPVRSPIARKAWMREQAGGGRVCMQRVLSPKLFPPFQFTIGGRGGRRDRVGSSPTQHEFKVSVRMCRQSQWVFVVEGGRQCMQCHGVAYGFSRLVVP